MNDNYQGPASINDVNYGTDSELIKFRQVKETLKDKFENPLQLYL